MGVINSKAAVEAEKEGARARLTLDLSQRMNADVERLAEKNNTTKADILRFAIELLTAADKAKDSGMNVGAWSEDSAGNRKEREFIGV